MASEPIPEADVPLPLPPVPSASRTSGPPSLIMMKVLRGSLSLGEASNFAPVSRVVADYSHY